MEAGWISILISERDYNLYGFARRKGERIMKLIMAIIKPFKVDAVREALTELAFKD